MNPSKKQYSAEFKEQALAKVYSRGQRTIQAIADESNLSIHTLKTWMSNAAPTDTPKPKPAKRPQDWRPEERLLALQESHGLTGEGLSACVGNAGYLRINSSSGEAIFALPPDRVQVAMTA